MLGSNVDVPLDRRMLVIGLAAIGDPEVRAIAQFAALSVLWDAVRRDLAPKLVVVDESNAGCADRTRVARLVEAPTSQLETPRSPTFVTNPLPEADRTARNPAARAGFRAQNVVAGDGFEPPTFGL